jgi:hypothetical protein
MRFRCKNPGVNAHVGPAVIGLDLGETFLKAARVAPVGLRAGAAA